MHNYVHYAYGDINLLKNTPLTAPLFHNNHFSFYIVFPFLNCLRIIYSINAYSRYRCIKCEKHNKCVINSQTYMDC